MSDPEKKVIFWPDSSLPNSEHCQSIKGEGRPSTDQWNFPFGLSLPMKPLKSFKVEWSEYLAACKARKTRIYAAQLTARQEVAEARERLRRAKSEPVPTPPMRGK